MKYDKLFAEFEERSVSELHGDICYADWDGMHSVKYDTWDWLMNVWYKFRDLKFEEETKSKLHTNYVARLAQDLAYGTMEEFQHNISIAIRWYNAQVVV
jgi:hypothetical protein